MTTPPADARSLLAGLIEQAIAGIVPAGATASIQLERPKQAQHGDFACNIAMQLAKPLRNNPRAIAQQIIAALPVSPDLEKAEIAGAGFINLFLTNSYKQRVVSRVLAAGEAYGCGSLGAGRRIQVEFVSANPTGPLHVGHGRGAAYGASLAAILAAAGFDVQREFYVNDAGRQMDILMVSVWMRYLEAAEIAVSFPPNGYQGEYVRQRAAELRAAAGTSLEREAATVERDLPQAQGDESDAELETLHENRMDGLIVNMKALLGSAFQDAYARVLERQLDECRDVLERFGVTFDRWFSEQSLYSDGKVAATLDRLQAAGHLYKKDGALWFRSTDFGDDKDRVVRRDNGLYTYFASDIAYHADKLDRGFTEIIDVWGADHHGYIPRVKAAITALGGDAAKLTVPLIQLVALFRNGEPVRMGKRSGNFVTLEELYGDVGVDAARFFYVLRKSDQHFDFDLDLAKSQSNDNPVYYIQYAHARVCSVLAQWGGDAASLRMADPTPLQSAHEAVLLKRLMEYPEVIEGAARDLAPHNLAFFLKEFAGEFHSYYNAERFLLEDEPLTRARLALALAVRQVLKNGLALLGVGAPEKM
ncbi:MAG: arginine--tRNA ligase [Betaproteobacteria bacterium]|jgi:arginyl-tRNA synthetase|nr:arginine--tRNA ligase [Betaproteobacteria bacterium]